MCRPIYGLIFLFKWQNKKNGQPAPEVDDNPNVFFANQVINNACATQAILQILLNRDDIEIGQELRNFKEFTADFPPDVRKKKHIVSILERLNHFYYLDERISYL